jgi:hypothetical protein
MIKNRISLNNYKKGKSNFQEIPNELSSPTIITDSKNVIASLNLIICF